MKTSTYFKIIVTAAVVSIVPLCFMAATSKGETMDSNFYGLKNEIPIISAAAERNKCTGKLYSILLAIRKAEGTPTFGIKHPACDDMVKADPNNAADIYASFAARTVANNYRRWRNIDSDKEWGGIPDFIDFLGNVYCPVKSDPQGNINWKKNVNYWFNKFEAASNS